ncbi:hypothetical protein BDBG_16571 [Blastomyces gilchristii SLH14081]|uniref:Uncharacterized protein n=1 Tax=Blastomyces gilchristii (strain SLH14081) TaxID=559298 RepID=A0A179UI77_BLAGS|nr:uncharacterized protein BDBG_16571 [Blastomyces gilchristii SLH14081]OAT06182.1 hypothetical protein BDBG_16571 [Blastomyces gilchristii SLH14081]
MAAACVEASLTLAPRVYLVREQPPRKNGPRLLTTINSVVMNHSDGITLDEEIICPLSYAPYMRLRLARV